MASTNIEQALDVKLRANTAWLATLTGGLHAYSALDGTAKPYGFYNVISDPTEEESFDVRDTGEFRVQFDWIGATKAAKSIPLAARKLLNHLAPWTDGVTVMSIKTSGVRDLELKDGSWQFQFDAQGTYVRA